MTVAQSMTAARLRGIAAGLLTAALAVAAHGAAGNVAPSGAAAVLLAALAVTVGGLATTVRRTADAKVLVLLLASSQFVGHVMLAAAGHSHGQPTSPGLSMVIAHALAVMVGALLIAAGDRLCAAVSRVVAVATRDVVAPVPSRPALTWEADQPLHSALLLAASVSHRGPPVSRAR